jgi:hypothetical protein
MLALSYIWFRCSVLLVTRKYHSTREPSPRPQTSQKGSKHLSFIAYIFSMFHCRASRKTGHTRARDSHVLPLLNNAALWSLAAPSSPQRRKFMHCFMERRNHTLTHHCLVS